MENNNPISEILYSKTINKFSRGNKIVGSLTAQVKIIGKIKFIQLTQEKQPYADSPYKKSSITLDPTDKQVKEMLSEAFKI